MSLMSGTEGLQALSFLDLPREIRNEIYRLLLFPWGKHVPYSKTRLVTVEDCDCPEPCACNWKIDTDLFRVSAQISEEARHYFYSHCYFRSKENISLPDVYAFLLVIGRENRSYIRRLIIERSSSRAESFTSEEGIRSPRGTSTDFLVRIIDLLSHGHSLRELILIFDHESLLLGYSKEESLLTALSKMRGVGSLSFSIYGYSPKAVNSILKTSGVLSSVQEVITKAQSEPVGVSHSTIRLPVLRRAQNQARGMLTLLNTHRSLMAGQREAEEASAYHQAEKDAAEERIIDFKTRAAAVEAELQKITNPVTDEGKRL